MTRFHSTLLPILSNVFVSLHLLLCPWSFFTQAPSPALFVSCLNLNPIENLFLRHRLDRIQSQARSNKGNYNFLQHKNRPNDDEEESVNHHRQRHHLVLIFPGAGGPDSFTMELEKNLMESLQEEKSTTTPPLDASSTPIVETLDWIQFRGSILSAAYDGEAFGEAIGELIMQQYLPSSISSNSRQPSQPQQQSEYYPNYYIHLIGISVGAFAANACCNILHQQIQQQQRQQQGKSSNQMMNWYTRLTLLDPFTSRGIGGWGYGNAKFGANADYAEHYLNTDDPVPTTNEPLNLCATWDVTHVPERETEFVLPENETMHCWPLVYFARYVCCSRSRESGAGAGAGAGRVLIHGKDGAPERGSVIVL